jgi:hypothetical protein
MEKRSISASSLSAQTPPETAADTPETPFLPVCAANGTLSVNLVAPLLFTPCLYDIETIYMLWLYAGAVY